MNNHTSRDDYPCSYISTMDFSRQSPGGAIAIQELLYIPRAFFDAITRKLCTKDCWALQRMFQVLSVAWSRGRESAELRNNRRQELQTIRYRGDQSPPGISPQMRVWPGGLGCQGSGRCGLVAVAAVVHGGPGPVMPAGIVYKLVLLWSCPLAIRPAFSAVGVGQAAVERSGADLPVQWGVIFLKFFEILPQLSWRYYVFSM